MAVAVDKHSLEQLLSSYNWWMGISTIAVALGILGEYVAHFIFEKEARRNKREMATSILFGALVLGGVVGEYIFGKKLTQVSEQLQQVADEAVAQSNKDAAQARRDAEIAKGDSAKADEKAGKANERASNNEREAAQLRKDAEAEHLARAKIEAAVAWRQLSERDKRNIGTAITGFKSLAIAGVEYNASSTEAEMFANDIAEALRFGQIVFSPPAGFFEASVLAKFGDPIRPTQTGVVIQSTDDDAARKFATLLIAELNRRGFDATRQTDPPFQAAKFPQIWVNVEPRPKGSQGEYKLQAKREAKTKKQASSK
jgi:hypothetical protein